MGKLRDLDHRLFVEDQRFDAALRAAIVPDCDRVLDVGCGIDGALLRRVPDCPAPVGVDLFLPTDPEVPQHEAYHRADVRDLADAFAPGSFDCVVALDVIEHLSRPDGLVLLAAMEAIARERVVIFTPNGFLPQPPEMDNPLQEHVSGWSVEDFGGRGYDVIGVNGWRPLRGQEARIKFRPRKAWWRVSVATERLVEHRPKHAFQLLAVKDVSGG